MTKPLSADEWGSLHSLQLSPREKECIAALRNGHHFVGERVTEAEARAEWRRWAGSADTLYGERAWLDALKWAGKIKGE